MPPGIIQKDPLVLQSGLAGGFLRVYGHPHAVGSGPATANLVSTVNDARCPLRHHPASRSTTYRCEPCGLVADRDLNAATNLASLVESVTSIGTATGAGTGRRKLPVNAKGEERFLGSPRCSSTKGEEGTSSELDKTVTATSQQVAPKPLLVGSDR